MLDCGQEIPIPFSRNAAITQNHVSHWSNAFSRPPEQYFCVQDCGQESLFKGCGKQSKPLVFSLQCLPQASRALFTLSQSLQLSIEACKLQAISLLNSSAFKLEPLRTDCFEIMPKFFKMLVKTSLVGSQAGRLDCGRESVTPFSRNAASTENHLLSWWNAFPRP